MTDYEQTSRNLTTASLNQDDVLRLTQQLWTELEVEGRKVFQVWVEEQKI